jgi:hypothetical protein
MMSHEQLAIFVSVDCAQLQQQIDAFLVEESLMNMIMATGVEFSNILTQLLVYANGENKQFFSTITRDFSLKYQRQYLSNRD